MTAPPTPAPPTHTPVGQEVLPWVLLGITVFGAGTMTMLSRQEQFALDQPVHAFAWIAILVSGAAAGVTAAAQRDIVSRGTLLDGAVLTAAVGVFSWMFPQFAVGDVGWDEAARLRLTGLGIGLGALLAAIIIIGLIRRPATIGSTAFVSALGLVLAGRIATASNELVSAGLILLACLAFVVSWVRRRSDEPTWLVPADRLRRPRWVLSLAAAAAAGFAIESSLRHERPEVGTGSLIVAGGLTAAAVISALNLRRQLQNEQGAFGSWFSGRRAEHSADFEAALYEYEPEPTRPLSEWTPEGELKLADESFWAMLGIKPQTDFHFGAIAHPEDRAGLAAALTQGLRHRLRLDHTFRAVDPMSGRERTIRLTATPSEAGTVLVEAQRIGSSRMPESRLDGFDDPALSNPVSGLRNTAFVARWLEHHAVENQRHTDNAMMVIIELIPLDDFDAMPDLLADVVVAQIGHRLTAECRSNDFVAHLDGPYFLWGARLAQSADRKGLLERITRVLHAPTETVPTVMPEYRMVTLRVEPGVDITRVLGVAAAAFTTEL